MKNTINTYFAALLITLAGVGAAWLIMHTATIKPFSNKTGTNEASYEPLKNSILND